ncbi:MAG: hypothetical protein NTX29_04890 [Actinobacteria bacterium]|nr:hypothetical protein [Actinomycetota bacterium]
MTDDNYLRDVEDQADPGDLAFTQEALAGLAFLRPDAPDAPGLDVDSDEPTTMPDWAWDRITHALAAESEIRAHGAPAVATRSSRATRWGGGLVAASVAIVALGLGVTMLRGAADVAVVAGDAPQASATAAPKTFEAAGAAAAAPLSPDVLTGPERMSFAGMVPPTQMLVDTDTRYTAGGLRQQVRSVLSKFGVGDEQEAVSAMTAAPVVEIADIPETGFMSSAESLSDCIDRLMEQAEATALLVDHASYEGRDAGVVVAPTDPAAISQSPAPELIRMHVWVIDPNCDPDPLMEIELTLAP